MRVFLTDKFLNTAALLSVVVSIGTLGAFLVVKFYFKFGVNLKSAFWALL